METAARAKRSSFWDAPRLLRRACRPC